MLELWVLRDRLRRMNGGDRRVVAVAELDPLVGGLLLEDVGENALELDVVAGVVAELGAGPTLEQVGAADAFAEVLPELLLARHQQDVAVVGGGVHLVAHTFFHPRRAR